MDNGRIDIAAIGRQQLIDTLNGAMSYCVVSEWLGDEGKPVKVYWKPLTGTQQREIDKQPTEVDRVCMTVKLRALDEAGRRIFDDTVPLVSLANDYDYDVIRAIAYLIAGNLGEKDGDEIIKDIEKE